MVPAGTNSRSPITRARIASATHARTFRLARWLFISTVRSRVAPLTQAPESRPDSGGMESVPSLNHSGADGSTPKFFTPNASGPVTRDNIRGTSSASGVTQGFSDGDTIAGRLLADGGVRDDPRRRPDVCASTPAPIADAGAAILVEYAGCLSSSPSGS